MTEPMHEDIKLRKENDKLKSENAALKAELAVEKECHEKSAGLAIQRHTELTTLRVQVEGFKTARIMAGPEDVKEYIHNHEVAHSELQKKGQGMSPVDETQREAAIEIIRDKGWPQMTTPRVYYPFWINMHETRISPADAEVILLSDHKEVVKGLEEQLDNQRDTYVPTIRECAEEIAELEALVKRQAEELTRAVDVKKDALKCNKELNDLVDRQALAIEKLKEQRNYLASHVPITSSAFNGDITGLDSQITAILQEAK